MNLPLKYTKRMQSLLGRNMGHIWIRWNRNAFWAAREYAENFTGNAGGKGAFQTCAGAMVRGGVLL